MKFYSNAVLFILIATGCSVINNPELDNANDAFNKGYYQTAIHYSNQVIRYDSLNTRAILLRGKSYSKLNESENAFRDYNTILQFQPEFEAYYNRGLEYLKNQFYVAAIDDFDKAISYDKTNSEVFFVRAYTKFLIDDLEGAMMDYERVIELDPTSFKAYINIGNILGSLGYGEQAIEKFNTAIKLQPDNPDGYFNRGNQKLIMNDLEGGIRDLSISLSKDKKNIPALLLLAELKIKASDNLGALDLLNRILESEENSKALFMRGSIYLKLEDRGKACADLNRAGELGFFDAYELINKYCAQLKKKK